MPLLAAAQQQDCISLEDTDGLRKYASGFKLTDVAAGTLGAMCCGDGALTLDALDLSALLTQMSSTVNAPAKYVDAQQTIKLNCATDKTALLSLASAALMPDTPPTAAQLAQFKLKCRDVDDPNGRVVFNLDGSDLSSLSCTPNKEVMAASTQTGVAASTQMGATSSAVTGTPAPVSPSDCTDLNELKSNPLKFLLGVRICVGDAGKFIVSPVDVTQIAAINNGNPLTLTGEFQPKGKDGFAVRCKLGSEFAKKLLPLAQELAKGEYKSFDVEEFKEIIDLRCHDTENRHLVMIDKTNVSGASFEDLKQVFEVSGITVNTFQQAYKKIADTDLEIGDFSLKDGKLTYPGGSVQVGDAVNFLSDQVAIIKKENSVTSVVTSRGVVTLTADGQLLLTTASGNEYTIAKGCSDATSFGGSVAVKCDGKYIGLRPGGLVSIDGEPKDPATDEFVKKTGFFVLPEFCDEKCRLQTEEALINSASTKGCQVSLKYTKDEMVQRGVYILSCPKAEDKQQAQLLLEEVALGVNGDRPENQHVAIESLEDVEDEMNPDEMKSSVAALQPVGAALAFVLAAATL